MAAILFILGVIVGMLVREIKLGAQKGIDEVLARYENRNAETGVSFAEAETFQDRFNKAESVDDTLKG